jgi:fermentation-respiration switch protein FrsA (DUF1100 family)
MIGFLERWLVFRPVHHEIEWGNPPSEVRTEDVWLSLLQATRVHAWWCVPEKWSPADGAVLFSHGYSGNLSHCAEGVRRLVTLLGQAVLVYDYPGYGRSTGKPSEAACIASAEAALDFIIREKHVPPERVLLYGGSLGGAMAIDLAARQPYRALLLVSAFTSIPDMARKRYPWFPIGRFIRNRFDNLAKIGRCPGRVFIAHGTADGFVPFSMAEQLFDAAREPKRFFPMLGHDHRHRPGPDFYNEVQRFLADHPGKIA